MLAITASQPDNCLFSPSLLLSHKVCLAAQASRHICNGHILFCPLWSRTGTRAIDSQCLLVMPEDEGPGTGAFLHDTPLSVRSAVSYPFAATLHQAMPETRTAGACATRVVRHCGERALAAPLLYAVSCCNLAHLRKRRSLLPHKYTGTNNPEPPQGAHCALGHIAKNQQSCWQDIPMKLKIPTKLSWQLDGFGGMPCSCVPCWLCWPTSSTRQSGGWCEDK